MLEEICHRGGSSAIGFLPGKACHMVLFPWGSSAMGFPGEGLPYCIPSGGTFAIWYNFSGDNLPFGSLIMKFVCGEIYLRGETLPYGIVFPPGEVLPLDFFRGKVCHIILPYGIISGGGGGVRGKNSHVTPACS